MLHNNRSFKYLLLSGFSVLLLAAIASCGKQDAASPGGINVELLIANLSPDLNTVDLYINNQRQNTTPFGYNSTPAYFFLGTTNQTLQIRTRVGDANSFLINDTLRSDTRYSLFIMGLKADSSLTSIFLADDTTQLAPVGKGGKMRFINSSRNSTGFDVYANGTLALKDVKFAKVSPYVQLPAGNYTFRVYPTGTTNTDLANVENVRIQDGRLYTLYSRGLVNRTDSARLGLAYITNK